MLLPTIPAPITTTLARAGMSLTRIPPLDFVAGSQHNEDDKARKAPAGRILTGLRTRASVPRRPIYRWVTADIRGGEVGERADGGSSVPPERRGGAAAYGIALLAAMNPWSCWQGSLGGKQ